MLLVVRPFLCCAQQLAQSLSLLARERFDNSSASILMMVFTENQGTYGPILQYILYG
jgi:hypothetical protein